MDVSGKYSTWTEINLIALQNNIRSVANTSGAPVMAVVKANAYGHGAIPVAKAALQAGAVWLAVARIEEALDLRQAGLTCPILLLGYTPPERLGTAIQNQLSLTVWNADQVKTAAMISQSVGSQARLHLKVDTGMSRLGVQIEAAQDLARTIANSKGILFEGIFTHFAKADEADPGPTDQQEQQFQRVLRALEKDGIRPDFVHAANSAASLTRTCASYDLVRAGISIYGLHPSQVCPLPASFQPVLSWRAVLSQVKTLPAGRGVSYGHEYITSARERIGTIPVGYADGFRRIKHNQVLVGGRRVPVVGRVCMDQIMVQLDGVPEAQAGDEVVIIGEQGGDKITAEQVAKRWGTINYEVVCGIGPRVPRLYLTA